MERGVRGWITAIIIGAAAVTPGPAYQAEAQEFKIPLNVSHLIYRPGENIAEFEEFRSWTVGLGLMIGVRGAKTEREGIYGLVAQATYGGPYLHLSGGVGMWNSGSPTTDDFGFGVSSHYNVFQSRDFKTRLGPQFGWSAASTGVTWNHVFTYRAVVSHTLSPSLSLYSGLGAETSRLSASSSTVTSTQPTALGGLHLHLGQGFALSTGVESVFTDPLYLTFAGSLQFDTGHDLDRPRPLSLRSRDAFGLRRPRR